MTSFAGTARRASNAEIAQVAKDLGVGLAKFRAIMAVESRNSGFDARKRPVILFEPHVFYRNLPNALRTIAVKAGLAYAKWRRGNYPRGTALQQSDGNYARLAAAIAINEEAAYRSISVGMGQVLGENFKAAGCVSAKAMFAEAKESEANQLRHMAGFIASKNLVLKINREDWRNFARVYNGPGQVEKYSAWLAEEHEKWEARLSRGPVSAKTLRDEGSRTIAGVDAGRDAVESGKKAIAGGGLSIATAAELASQAHALKDTVDTGVSTVEQGKDILGWAVDNWQWFAIVGLALLAAYFGWQLWRALHAVENKSLKVIEAARIDDEDSGVHLGRL